MRQIIAAVSDPGVCPRVNARNRQRRAKAGTGWDRLHVSHHPDLAISISGWLFFVPRWSSPKENGPAIARPSSEGELSSRMGVWDEITTTKGFRRNYVRWLETPRK